MAPRPFRPLSASLVRTILMWAALSTLAFAVLQGWLSYRAAQARFEVTFSTIGQQHAKALSMPIWEVHPEGVQQQLAAMLLHPSVGYAAVAGFMTPPHQAGDASLRDSDMLRLDIPNPKNLGRPIATLELAMSRQALYAEVGQAVLAVVLQCAALTALLMAVVMVVLRRQLQQPLAQLRVFVQDLKAGELDKPLALRRGESKHADEIDLVAEGFASLQHRISEHIHTLDAQVQERTAQLQAAMQQLSTLATTDALTGCHNRLSFTQRFPEELARAQRYGRPLSAIFCDVDHFKAVNDQYGHAVGDQVLAAVGRCLRDSSRSSGDWVVRYGGEEFVLVLPETPLVDALEAAERMRRCIEQQVRVPIAGGQTLQVTVSFGVAEHQAGANAESGEALLKRADAWLYTAKAQGRNQVQPAADMASA